MPRIRHHRSSGRVPLPSDSDFDHEIKLVNRDEDRSSLSGPPSAGPSTSRRHETPASGTAELQVAERDGGSGEQGRTNEEASQPSVQVEEPTPQTSPESAVDILYENQRGGFLCGIPLFSAKALGNLDPPAWTNYAHKPSPTDIYTAQVPDPSWEWAWPEWRVNKDEGADEDGWDYSFAFSSKFSWHKPRWWNSFVRRRAWIRKRVKKDAGYLAQQDPRMLNPAYFTVRPSLDIALDRSPSRASSARGSRLSLSTVNTEGGEQPVIENADVLLCVLRASRIDREKIEAVDSYLKNAQDELEGLQEIMHDIMSFLIFQASRRVLLSKLTEFHDKTAAEQKKSSDASPGLDRKLKNLTAAVKHADEEVRRLEYWSDVKGIAEKGESKGAVDKKQGWDTAWQGVDKSGPSAPPAPPKYEEGGRSEDADTR